MNVLALPTLASRIRAALLGVALAAVGVATAGALFIGHHALDRQMETHLGALATVTATQSQAPLLFGDRDAALDVLRAIPAEEGIRLGEIRDAQGKTLARLEREDHSLPDLLERALAPEAATGDVVVDGRHVGSVTLQAGGRPLFRSMMGMVGYNVLGAFAMALLVLAVARRLTLNIARPLDALGAVMRNVHVDRDYARRAPRFAVAEIDELRSEFNALLDEIQRRDQELQRTNAALKRLALRDPLTGLANRAMFESALLQALGRDGRAGVGVLYFDLDSFKAVNDTFGHAAGDLLLRAVASRLDECVPAGAVAARIGGDEFVVALPDIATHEALAALAQRLQHALHAPVRAGIHVIHPGASVGYALSSQNTDAAQLIDLADRAMYVAKQQRRDAGIRTRWEPVDPGAEDGAWRPPRRVRESGPIKILGDRNVQQRSA
jgi:diguanylate cyclase (GGDEF)-like protein